MSDLIEIWIDPNRLARAVTLLIVEEEVRMGVNGANYSVSTNPILSLAVQQTLRADGKMLLATLVPK
jgi:hypothetical protein